MSNDRTAEIWSTRLQRELLALSESSQQQLEEPSPITTTTTSASKEDPNGNKDEESEESNDKKAGGEEGEAKETTNIPAPVVKPKKISKANADIALLPPFIRLKDHILDIEEGVCKVTFDIDVCPIKKVVEDNDNDNDNDQVEKREIDTNIDENEESKEDATETTVTAAAAETSTVVVDIPTIVSITLDVSLERNRQGEPIANPNTYPFQKPRAILKIGQDLFPPNSDISNGDCIEVDCDWTPSLHLSDAALNVSLKIRECIRKGFPFRKAEIAGDRLDDDDDYYGGGDGNTIFSRVIGSISSVAAAATSSLQQGLTEEELSSPRQQQQQHLGIIHIGDEVNLNEEPFSLCVGMYPVKTLRRPEFMQVEINQAEIRRQQLAAATATNIPDDDDENEIPSGWGNYMGLQSGGIKKVAGAGLTGAGSMFKSAWRSTTKVLEESYLMITDDFILELRATKFNATTATVTYIIPISLLAKLKFRRNESLSLFFKQAQDDPYIIMCPDSYEAVQQIQSMLQRYGVKGKHTNSTAQRLIQEAMMILYDVQNKEKALETSDPSTATVESVKDIMNLYRQAAELLETANDPRYEEIMAHMREFLAKPLVLSLLDSDKESQSSSTEATLNTTASTAATTDEEPQRKSTADILKDADDIFNDDDDNANIDDSNLNTTDNNDDDDMVDLDAMLSAADKELDEIIKS